MPIKLNAKDLSDTETKAIEFVITQTTPVEEKSETVQAFLDRLLPGQSAIDDYIRQMKEADASAYAPLFSKALLLPVQARRDLALFVIEKCTEAGIDLSDLDPTLLAFS